MNIHEYQAKQLLSQYNIPVLDGFVAFNQEQLGKNISSLNGPKWVVKAQIHAGGRGKGGGVKVVDTIEAGIVLLGSEVKSLRLGRASIAESYATEEYGHVVLINSNIPEYSSAASGQNHEPKRVRRLLIHKKEKNKILGQIKKDGCTVVPLSLFFNQKGLAKISLGIAEGKKKVDKREVIKKRDWDREKHRLLKNNN